MFRINRFIKGFNLKTKRSKQILFQNNFESENFPIWAIIVAFLDRVPQLASI